MQVNVNPTQYNNTVNPNAGVSPAANNAAVTPAAAAAANEAPPTNNIVPTDEFVPSGENPTSFRPDRARMQEILSHNQRMVDSFRQLVSTLLNTQIETANLAGQVWDFSDPNAMVDIEEATRAEAQAAIGEGGYFSVEAVATRLLDFAVAISGGDPSRIDVLRNAVQAGFDAAAERWGGELPEISQQTHAAVMEGFDQWQAAGSVSAIALLNRD